MDTVKLYFLDDGEQVVAPASFQLELWNGKAWQTVPNPSARPTPPRMSLAGRPEGEYRSAQREGTPMSIVACFVGVQRGVRP